MKKRVSPGARRAIILIHARSISRLETAFGRCDREQLRNLLVHYSGGRPPQVLTGLQGLPLESCALISRLVWHQHAPDITLRDRRKVTDRQNVAGVVDREGREQFFGASQADFFVQVDDRCCVGP